MHKQKFTFLADEPEASTSEVKKKEKKDKKSKKDQSHVRKRGEDDGWQSDEDERAAKRRKEDERLARSDVKPEAEMTEEELEAQREADRLQDAKERDEFSARLREKETSKSRKLVEDRTSNALSAEARARQKLAEDSKEREAAMPSLRLRSREEYLVKREQQQLDLLRLEIADFEADLRGGASLTKRETKELAAKKELLRLTEERARIDDGTDGYMMPSDYITESGKIDRKKKSDALYKRYDDNKRARDQEQFVTDTDRFEEEQAKSSILRTGALDRVAVEQGGDYDYVFDESAQIGFVLDADDRIAGNMSVDEMELQAKIDAAEQRGMLKLAHVIFCH